MAVQRADRGLRGFSRLVGARAWASGCGLLLCLVAASARGEAVALSLDQAREVALSPPPRLPLLGPRYAAVTLDLFIPVGHRGGDNNLGLALRFFRESPDVRLLLHPVITTPLSARGAEVIWEAFEQQPTTCFAFITELYRHPEWLAVSADGQEELLAAAATAGLDAARLRQSLLRHRHRATVTFLWQAFRGLITYPPELWVNGKRLRGALSDFQLRDELDRQRAQAQRALQSGTPLTKLHEQLVAQEAVQRADELPSRRMRLLGGTVAQLPPATGAVRLDLAGVPSRGPDIAPVTLAVVGSIDTNQSCLLARAAYAVWSRHADSVRLVYLQAPAPENERNALQLTQLAIADEERFWRVFRRMLDLLPRVYSFDRGRIDALIREENGRTLIDPGFFLPEARRRMTRDLEQVRRLGIIEYSPLVLVNGLPVRGAPLEEKLESAVVHELQRGLLQRLHAPPTRVDYSWVER